MPTIGGYEVSEDTVEFTEIWTPADKEVAIIDMQGVSRVKHQNLGAYKDRQVKSITPRSLTLVLDHLPYRELSPNQRLHWSQKAPWVKAAKEEIGWLAKEQWHDDKPMMRAQISYEFHLANNRARDLDNLLASCKPWQDGLIEAGVIFYDDAAHLSIGKVEAKVTGKWKGVFPEETIVRVEEV